ncbi:hypothetical protein NMG60_11002603 [Bertholletia excelsa]
MGCKQSKIETDDTVARCKLRRQHIESAVLARNAFAVAQTSYGVYLKNAGASLCEFSRYEFQHPHTQFASVHASSESVRPPPPPEAPGAPLQRAASMPEISIRKSKSNLVDQPIIEEENEEEIEAESLNLKRRSSRRPAKGVTEEGLTAPPPAPPPERPQIDRSRPYPPPSDSKEASWGEEFFFPSMDNVPGSSLAAEVIDESRIEIERKVYEEKSQRDEFVDGARGQSGKGMKAEATVVTEMPADMPPAQTKALKKVKQDASAESSKKGSKSGTMSRLMQIYIDLDDYFLKASQSAHDVVEMLQANRMHYHPNYADNRGHMDHSARIMCAITWNRSFNFPDNEEFVKYNSDPEECESHASVLDMILAWEKKLYDEMKTGEYMKLAYQRKFTSLHKLKQRGASSEAIEKTKAALSTLHTRYIVDIQSMDKTVSEINSLRDQQLFPRLVELVGRMATMWLTMRIYHEKQAKIAAALRYFDELESPKEETTDHHYYLTKQLKSILKEWRCQFENLITFQKKYVQALNSWLSLNLVHIDNNAAEKVENSQTPLSSEDNKQAEKFEKPHIQALLFAWRDYLENLPCNIASTAIANLEDAITTILHYQEEELKLRNKCEDTRKQIARKKKQYDDWYEKDMKRKKADDDIERAKEIIAEKQFAIELAEQRLQGYEENYKTLFRQAREQTFMSLNAELPKFFKAMWDFSRASSAMYKNLWSISQVTEQ